MTRHPAAHPQFLRDGAGDVLQFSPSERLIWKAAAATTAGAFDQFELTPIPIMPAPPEHCAIEGEERLVHGVVHCDARRSQMMAGGPVPAVGDAGD
jgi:hypothetical protein